LRGEFLTRRKNGSLFWESATISPVIDADGKTTHFIGVKEDITERKKFEAELIQAKTLAEQSERLKDAFIANISHEIRTPLNVILGYIRLISSEYRSVIRPEDRYFFESTDKAGQRLMRSVEQILNISSIQTNSYVINAVPVVVRDRVAGLMQEFIPLAARKSIEFSFVCDESELYIYVDPESFDQAIMNVLDNAVKFTDKGYVIVRVWKENASVMIEISDTGIGIAEEYLPQLYSAFSQEAIGYTRRYQGLGLGLTLVGHYVRLNGGEIEAKSEKGVGTSFRMSFPLADENGPLNKPDETIKLDAGARKEEPELIETGDENNLTTPERETASAKDAAGAYNGAAGGGASAEQPACTVLVVEDDEQNQQLILAMFRRRYNMLVSPDAEGALDLLEEHKVDVMLLDLSLSGQMDGIELAKMLRKDDRYKDLPIIALTAHAFPKDRQNCMDAGCTDYMAKPFHREQLRRLVESYVSPS
jgi:signal transduction histidine kinase/CheY-like chemotaxis protein